MSNILNANEEENETRPHIRISTVEMKLPQLSAPETPKRAEIPSSVLNALQERKWRQEQANIERLREMHKRGELSKDEIEAAIERGYIEPPKPSIFQQLQTETMKKILDLALNFLRANWRTTVAGLGAMAATALAKLGINLGQAEIDAIMAIGYAIIFKFSDIRWDVGTIIGVVLMTLSFFVSPALSLVGASVGAETVAFVQLALQQAVGALLKDQKAYFQKTTEERPAE